LTMPISGIA